MPKPHRLSLPAHGALELLVGLALLGLPFALGLGPAALVIAVAAGALVAGLGLSGTDWLPIGSHQALDQALVAALAGCTVALAVRGDVAGAILLGCGAVVELTLVSATRWSRRR
jgi:hypothetical protein